MTRRRLLLGILGILIGGLAVAGPPLSEYEKMAKAVTGALIPLPLTRRITGTCVTVGTGTGAQDLLSLNGNDAGATIGRAYLDVFTTSTTNAVYCVPTSFPNGCAGIGDGGTASIASYLYSLAAATTANVPGTPGGEIDLPLTSGTDLCCATNASTNTVCYRERMP